MITIGMPVHERMTYIKSALESCFKQTYTDYEIVMIDTSSHNQMRELVSSYGEAGKKIRYFHNAGRPSITSKLNQLVAESRGEWMLILCDDDYLEPDFLSTLSHHIQNYPSASLIRCRYRLIDHAGKELRLDRLSPFQSKPFEFLRDIFLPESQTFKMNISGILFPRDLLKSLGGFKELYRGWHVDRLAWAELGARGETLCDPAPLCNVRLHPGSLSAFTEPDYKSAVLSDMRVKEIGERLFAELSENAKSDDDWKTLKMARRNFHAYINRHLSKSLDHGFMAALINKESGTGREINEIFKTMKDLKVPLFQSAILYRLLVQFPHSLRTSLLTSLRKYKIKKLTS
jgi:glycosyltransferase involved in cell wall biosynthesis